jgi:hypothetical protein
MEQHKDESALIGKSNRENLVPNTFLTLPLEIRYRIYDQLLNSPHIIIISPNGTKRGVLKPVVRVCKQVREEVQKWLEGQKESTIIHSLLFGIFNDKCTTFKISWAIDDTFCSYDLGILTGSRFQRCYIPGHPARDLGRLEMWQKAMDLMGSDRLMEINRTLTAHPAFFDSMDDLGRFLRHQEEDWWVLDEKRFQKPPMQGQIVWSIDFKTHAEHQCYTRQHPREEERVRKVECGLAFEFRLEGSEFDFVEVK